MSTRQPGDDQSFTQAPPVATATKSEADALLIAGQRYDGSITQREEDGTYSVTLDYPRITITGALVASAVIGGLMGFNVRTKLGPGTLVELAWGRTPFITAVHPPTNRDQLNGQLRLMLWDADDIPEGIRDKFTEAPVDLLDGECEISNMFGVAMEFLTTLIRMGASDRARIECSLTNDMVRIISAQYRHFSGMGEELIFDHGRPTLERTWSSYRHELMDKLKEGEAFADLKGDAIDRDAIKADRLTAIGRYRLIEFVGFAGDFIHSFVTDPPETIARMMKEMGGDDAVGAGAGKSWIHRNSDGSCLIQSVADIRIERVARIPVPFRQIPHETQALMAKRDYTKLKEDYAKLMDFGDPKQRSAYRVAYQIRVYARWLSRFHAFTRMLQLSDDYKLPTETESPEPSWTNLEADKQRVNADSTYYDAYACITIMRDGSIVMHDGYGSTVSMSNGNVHISASRHLDLEAAGDIRMYAGGSFITKVRRSIEMTAETGGILFFCQSWFKALCNKGSVWLRSAADVTATPEAVEDGPVPIIAGSDDASPHPVAVLIEATTGNVVVRADSGIGMHIEGKPPSNGYDTPTHNFTVSTPGNIKLQADHHVMLAASGELLASGQLCIALSSARIYGKLGEIDILNGNTTGLLYRNGSIFVGEVTTRSLSANTARVLRKPPQQDPEFPRAEPVAPHLNHVDVLRQRITDLPGGTDAVASAARAFVSGPGIHTSPNPWSSSSAGPVWSFSLAGEYHWDTRDEEKGSLVESLTQQYLKLDVTDDPWSGPGYSVWTWVPNELQGPRVGKAGGFGADVRTYVCNSGDNLHKPSAKTADEIASGLKPTWVSEQVTMKILKRQ